MVEILLRHSGPILSATHRLYFEDPDLHSKHNLIEYVWNFSLFHTSTYQEVSLIKTSVDTESINSVLNQVRN